METWAAGPHTARRGGLQDILKYFWDQFYSGIREPNQVFSVRRQLCPLVATRIVNSLS
jgi:hypothetical protein